MDKVFRKGKDVAIRSNTIVEAKYDLTGKENDIVDMVLAEIEQDDVLEYEISVKKYKQYYQLANDNNIYAKLKRATQSIESKRIYSQEINSKKSYSWFPKIEYKDNEGKIIVELHKDIKKAMVEFKSGIYYHLKYTFPLTSDYAKRYYYYCKSFQRTGYRVDIVDDVKEKLEASNKYPLYSDFKRFVVIPAITQINERSDIKVDFEELFYDKNKNKVTHLKMTITPKTKEELESIKIDNNVNLMDNPRSEIVEMFNKVNIDIKESEAKKIVAKRLNTSIKTVNRYLNLTNDLIDEAITSFDNKEVNLREITRISKMNKDEQLDALNKLLIINDNKNSVKTVKEKRNVIDVDYKCAKKDSCKDDDTITMIIKNELKELKLTDKQAQALYDKSERSLEHIMYIYNELKMQHTKIPNPVGWLMKMVEPEAYIKPSQMELEQNDISEYDQLERLMLGWDGVDDYTEDEVSNIIKGVGNYTSNNTKRIKNNHTERRTTKSVNKKDVIVEEAKNSNKSLIEELEKLIEYRNNNIISEEEFIRLKSKLIS